MGGEKKSSLFLWGAVVLLSLLVFMVLLQIRDQLMAEREDKARYLVETAYNLIDASYRDAQVRHLNLDAAHAQALANLKMLRFGGNDYFWVQDLRPVMLLHPSQPNLIGQDLSQFRDARGKLLFQEILSIVKQGNSGVLHYYWPKPGQQEAVEKVSFVRLFEPWGWVVGSGVYVEDVNEVFYWYAGLYLVFLLCLILPVAILFDRSLRRKRPR